VSTPNANTSEALLNDMFDLLVERLPMIPVGDPGCEPLRRMLPRLARNRCRSVGPLGRPPLTLV
jgi:hypothetical protein